MARYLIFSAHYPPFVGGIPNFVAHLADQLVKEGESVTVVTSALEKDMVGWHTVSEQLKFLYMPTKSFMGGRLPLMKKNHSGRELEKELERQSFDYVLVNARFYDLSLFGVKFAAKKGIPCVVLDHGSEPLTLNNALLDVFLGMYERHMTKKIARYQPIFAGISPASLRLLERFGIVANAVIPNAIDVKAFVTEAALRSFRRELGIDEEAAVVVHISRLEPEKGTSYVLKAAKVTPDKQVIFAGSGSLSEEVSKAAKAYPNIHYVGKLTKPEVSALFSEADAFVFPTRSEGAPTIVLEAAAQGVPVYATRVGNIDQMLPDKAWYVPIEQSEASVQAALESCIQPSQEVKQNLRAHIAKQWGWSQSTHALRKAYVPASQKLPDYNQDVLPRLQEELTELLRVLDATCKKLDITYWIEGGTLLGALRHGGFIPWDDDIDVGMQESDWRHFVELAPDALPKGYKLVTGKNTWGFSALWVCLVKEDSRFIDAEHLKAHCELGIFIDVFCFVSLDKRPLFAKVQRLTLRLWQGLSYLHVGGERFKPWITRRFWKAAHTSHPGDALINPSYADYAPIPKNVILPTKPIRFGELSVTGPANPERYLELEYNTWQELPPPQARHTHAPLILDFGDGKNVVDSNT